LNKSLSGERGEGQWRICSIEACVQKMIEELKKSDENVQEMRSRGKTLTRKYRYF
jgi:hypothetical protein